MTFEGETSAERMMLRRDAQETFAEQAAQEHQKGKEGQTQKVSSGRCTSWQPPARGGIQIPGTVDEGAYYESILLKGYESILTKGYESILWMVFSPAWQAAGDRSCFAGSQIHMVHHGELKVRDHGLCVCSPGAIEKPNYNDLGCDTELKSNVVINKEKTYVLPDGNIVAVGAERFHCCRVPEEVPH